MGTQKKSPTSFRWILAAILLTSPLPVLFILAGDPGQGRIAWILALVLVIVAKVRWRLHSHSWFWVALALIALAESPIVIFIRWTDKWIPAAVLIPFGIADCIAILWVLQIAEQWMAPTRQPETDGARGH